MNDIEDSDDWSHLDDTYAVDENDRWDKYGDNIIVTLDPQDEVNHHARHQINKKINELLNQALSFAIS
jgi:hypothetical protein